MKNNHIIKIIKYSFTVIVIMSLFFGFDVIEKYNDKNFPRRLDKVANAYYMKINNIEMPLNNYGILADVSIPPNTAGGKFDERVFLFLVVCLCLDMLTWEHLMSFYGLME